MIDKQTIVTVNSGALLQKVGVEMVILDSVSGQYYTLNEIATEILEQFQLGHNVATVLEHICQQYDVNETEANQDIYDMLATLSSKELVTIV